MTEHKPLLEITGLSVGYPSAPRPAVEHLSLRVEPGQVAALVGQSGSGKSTTATAVLRQLPPEARITAGAIRLDGLDLTQLSETRMCGVRGKHVALVPQDPGSSLNPVKRVGEQVAEVLRRHCRADRRSAARQAVELLDRMGLDDPGRRARQYPHELSGGMRQRVLIAQAVATQPRLILADEPTSALDATAQKAILDLLDTIVRTSGAGLLLITHDLAVAAERSDTVYVLHAGRVVESGATDDVFAEPRHAHTRELLASVPDPQAPVRAPAPGSGAPLLTVTGLSKQYRTGWRTPGPPAVDAVDLVAGRGQTTAVVGESGSGKTTLARMVLRLTEATAGEIDFAGLDVRAVRGRELRAFRRRAQIVYQNPYSSLDPRFTVGQIVYEPFRALPARQRPDPTEVVPDLLTRVGLEHALVTRRPRQLSGGQRQRVAIARAIATQPDLLVLDEAVSALDVSVQAQVLRLLRQLQDELGLTYLFISHDIAVVRQMAHHVLVMRAGRVVEAGPAAQLLDTPRHPYTRALLDAVPRGRRRGTATTEDRRTPAR
ncbi:dipeptide ABC transporter ATP-binding protein [Phytohabitans suffuscus]|uniref:ABC transporter ATP-binding protein n=1 Tax=Phytohabitans suffuscus TaxID=624315 RepID=A0A6F8YFP9_9ACTN|nr:ABC transporter ATP-binding protein [Phytohabitans suffuscus]BCB84771.1 ABC transporter ATP-binding protein [Phytohabitans suffuscus]